MAIVKQGYDYGRGIKVTDLGGGGDGSLPLSKQAP